MISGSMLVHKNKIKLHLDVANVPPFEGLSSYLYVVRSGIKRRYQSWAKKRSQVERNTKIEGHSVLDEMTLTFSDSEASRTSQATIV